MRKYFVPFERVPNSAKYDDKRDEAPSEIEAFFDSRQ
jgi:hypothetical protein